MTAIRQAVVSVEGVRTFYRHREGIGAPTVFVHGNPTHSEDWMPFLAQINGAAVALDMPGWGYSERPPNFDYSMFGLGNFVARFLDTLGIAEHSLVVHDWGVVGLIAAQQRPASVNCLVIINGVPLLPGFRWHWVARWFWRRRVIGELANRSTTKSSLAAVMRWSSPARRRSPAQFLEAAMHCWPPGDPRPEMLELYRSADPERLEAAGDRLARLDCPALVVWGAADPFIPVAFARAYAELLPAAELAEFEAAGHWPWIERPEIVDRVTGFLAAS